jgi:tRNA threonylcarbamoyladenosine biosynthesis protein TsaB
MRLLAIDTSGRACSMALFQDGALIAERHEEIGRGHAERIIPWIAELPVGGRAEAILVGCGPGSFTGVRVGIAAARALGLGWGVPVHGLDSLSLIAAAAEGRPVLVAIEGGHGEVFVQSFSGAPLTPLSGIASLTVEAAAERFAQEMVLGSAAERLVAARGSGLAKPAEARAALALSLPEMLRLLPPSPIYGRAPDARPMP